MLSANHFGAITKPLNKTLSGLISIFLHFCLLFVVLRNMIIIEYVYVLFQNNTVIEIENDSRGHIVNSNTSYVIMPFLSCTLLHFYPFIVTGEGEDISSENRKVMLGPKRLI